MDQLAAHVASLGDIVTVWAHPDDETYLAGGLMATARAIGARVTCIVATDGDFSDSPTDRLRLGCLRRSELCAALDALDVHDRHFLHLPDGGCSDLDEAEPVEAIGRILTSRSPATVVTFGPDGFTGHADHRAVSRWTTAAARAAAPTSRILHPTITPSRLAEDRDITDRHPIFDDGLPVAHDRDTLALELELRGHSLDTKLRALRGHDSQTRGLITSMGLDRYRRWVSAEMFVDAVNG
ncbi:MAG TPA: PIG-L family deacetylase [Acidimicrobiales bacterium]|nr:PIG-L family deacetylase [Acidimicrobiales bacterium]